ncbi:hypothetical protein ACJX0J_026241 [Zea mays]
MYMQGEIEIMAKMDATSSTALHMILIHMHVIICIRSTVEGDGAGKWGVLYIISYTHFTFVYSILSAINEFVHFQLDTAKLGYFCDGPIAKSFALLGSDAQIQGEIGLPVATINISSEKQLETFEYSIFTIKPHAY